jgi:Flp pilus assembly pilin Flp
MDFCLVVLPGLLRLRHDKQAQDLIEYAMLAAFMAMVVVALLPEASVAMSGLFSQVSSALMAAAGLGSTGAGSGSGN